MQFDVFISHASEDKADVVRPLAAHLMRLGFDVWFDEFELTLGDSLRRSIDRGLTQSRFAVVILSPAFFAKEWPNKELDGLVAREDGREKVILPVWHNVSQSDVIRYSPILADRLAVSTSKGLENVAEQISHAISRATDTLEASLPNLGPSSGEVLEGLRYKMFTAKSSFELRKTLYELEDHLDKYPRSPEGLMLQDRLKEALWRAEAMEHPPFVESAPASRPKRSSLVGWAALMVILVMLLIYILYQIMF